MNYLRQHSGRVTPQSEPMRSDQTPNAAGGYTWDIDDWARLRRFLILGAEGGTYYQGQTELVKENAAVVGRCLEADGARAVDLIREISDGGLAPQNDVALFALAMASASSDPGVRAAVWDVLPNVARTGTHLLHFVAFMEQFRGWGPSARRGVGRWYTSKTPSDLAYQLVKYRQRDGWSQRDILRKVHPKAPTALHAELFEFVTGNASRSRLAPSGDMRSMDIRIIDGFRLAQAAMTPKASAALIRDYNLPREAVNTDHLKSPEVWEALLERMPMGAMIRNLANMTRAGIIKPLSAGETLVTQRLGDAERLQKARVHPIAVLSALRVYAAGKGVMSRSEGWTPSANVVDALDGAFYDAFKAVEPSGKRTLIALDISGSMTHEDIAGIRGLTPREGAAAMALVTLASEPITHTVAFTGPYVEDRTGWGRPEAQIEEGLIPFPLSARERLDDVAKKMKAMPFGRTDCAAPMVYATEQSLEVDTFVIYTDNETWAGSIHPMQALRQYRERSGIPARLVVVGMTSARSSIGDPDDAGVLDVIGFDASAPATISAFARGEV